MGISLRLDFIERTITATTPHKQQSKMQTFHYSAVALLFACVALCASQNQAQEVPPKEVCEADVDDCVSSNTAFKCAMMFKNLTDLPLKVLDIIPDLIAQNDDPEITAELEKKEISFEAFEIDDVCPAPGVTGGQRLKQINQAKEGQRQMLRLPERLRLLEPLELRPGPDRQQGLEGGDRRRRAVRARLRRLQLPLRAQVLVHGPRRDRRLRLLLRHLVAGGLHRRQAPRPQREALLRAQQEERQVKYRPCNGG